MMQKRRSTAALAAAFALGAMAIPALRAEAATQTLGAVASASEEIVAVAAGDTGASAVADFQIDGATGDICVRATFTGLSGPVMMAHIHSGAAAVNGPVLVTLPVTGAGVNGCVKATPADAAAIVATPGAFYFNAHTAASPGGAVRGQLTSSMFNATLSGASEVPGPGATNGTGTAVVALDTAANRACVLFTLDGIEIPAAAAHIHSGTATVAGPVILPLPAPSKPSSVSCAPSTPAVLAAIVAAPSAHYANVHTSQLPAGAVRGQLSVRSLADFPVASGAAPIPTTTIAPTTTVASTSTTVAPATTTVAPATVTTVPAASAPPAPATPVAEEPTFTG